MLDGAGEPSAQAPAWRWLGRRSVVLGAAALLLLATALARELSPGNRDELLGLMFVIPIALAGLELGTWGGVAVGTAALVWVALRGSHSEPSFDSVGLAMRGVVFVGVGALAGRFSDRMRAHQARQTRLLEIERERAGLAGELHCLRARLEDQFRNAGHILDLHERERRGIAEQLHEQAAQAMAAALLVVGRLERDIVDELTQAQLARVRRGVDDCIEELRRLAGALRSPVLEELGLRPALERLCERERDERSQPVELRFQDEGRRLPADAEISAYRVIAEALSAVEPASALRVSVRAQARSLRIEVEAPCPPERERIERERIDERLRTARARLEMIGGSLLSSHAADRLLLAGEIPLASLGEP